MRAVLRLDLRIVLVRVHAERDVGRERPRRSRPGEEVRIFQPLSLEAHEHGRFLDVLVPLRHLVRGERRAAARAVRDDLMPLVQEPLLPDLFQRPPDRLDVLVVVGDVRVFHVRPVAHAFGHFFPFALVFPDAFLAFFDKRLDAVFFDVLLAVHAEHLFHFQLDGQTVRVPARFAQDVLALHRLIAGNDVLHHAGENVADVRLAVCRGRAVVERKLLSALSLLHAVLKHVLLFPERDHFLFALDKVHRRVYLGIKLFL